MTSEGKGDAKSGRLNALQIVQLYLSLRENHVKGCEFSRFNVSLVSGCLADSVKNSNAVTYS